MMEDLRSVVSGGDTNVITDNFFLKEFKISMTDKQRTDVRTKARAIWSM